MCLGGDSWLVGYIFVVFIFLVMMIGFLLIGFIFIMMVGVFIFDFGFELLLEVVW